MLKRIVTTAIGLPILFYVITKGSALLTLALMVVACIGLNEFYRACLKLHCKPVSWVGYLGTVVLFLPLVFTTESFPIILRVSLTFILLLVIWVFKHPDVSLHDVTITWFGFMYVPLMLLHIALIDGSQVAHAVWLVFIISWACDTGAYLVGISLGKHKLCPAISPKKTVEGAAGGIIGSIIGCIVFGYLLYPSKIVFLIILGVIGAVVSQVGDLAASLVKRTTGLKDFGSLFPGHGGILDRFDSILFTAPIVYFALHYWNLW